MPSHRKDHIVDSFAKGAQLTPSKSRMVATDAPSLPSSPAEGDMVDRAVPNDACAFWASARALAARNWAASPQPEVRPTEMAGVDASPVQAQDVDLMQFPDGFMSSSGVGKEGFDRPVDIEWIETELEKQEYIKFMRIVTYQSLNDGKFSR